MRILSLHFCDLFLPDFPVRLFFKHNLQFWLSTHFSLRPPSSPLLFPVTSMNISLRQFAFGSNNPVHMHLVCVYDYVMLFFRLQNTSESNSSYNVFHAITFSAHFLLLFDDLHYVKQLQCGLRTNENIALIDDWRLASALPYTNKFEQ